MAIAPFTPVAWNKPGPGASKPYPLIMIESSPAGPPFLISMTDENYMLGWGSNTNPAPWGKAGPIVNGGAQYAIIDNPKGVWEIVQIKSDQTALQSAPSWWASEGIPGVELIIAAAALTVAAPALLGATALAPVAGAAVADATTSFGVVDASGVGFVAPSTVTSAAAVAAPTSFGVVDTTAAGFVSPDAAIGGTYGGATLTTADGTVISSPDASATVSDTYTPQGPLNQGQDPFGETTGSGAGGNPANYTTSTPAGSPGGAPSGPTGGLSPSQLLQAGTGAAGALAKLLTGGGSATGSGSGSSAAAGTSQGQISLGQWGIAGLVIAGLLLVAGLNG